MDLCEAVMIAGILLVGMRLIQMKHLFDKYNVFNEFWVNESSALGSFIKDAGIPVGIAFFVLWAIISYFGYCPSIS